MTQNAQRYRGFILLIGLTYLMFLSVVVVALSGLLHVQLQRTERQARDAQARQLLIAGGRLAPALVEGYTAENPRRGLELPESLARRDGSLTITVDPSDHGEVRRATLRATCDGHRAVLVLKYAREQGRWRLRVAEPG